MRLWWSVDDRIEVSTVRWVAGASFNPFEVVLHHSPIRAPEADRRCLRPDRHATVRLEAVAGCAILGSVAAYALAHHRCARGGSSAY